MTPNSTHTSALGRTKDWFVRWVVIVGLAVFLLVSGGVAHADEIADEVQTYTQLLEAIEALEVEHKTLEAKHDEVTARVQKLKKGSGPVAERELQLALTEARGLAEILSAMTTSIGRVSLELESQRERVIAAYDDEIASLEEELVTSSSPERQIEIVGLLDEMQKARAEYRAARASVEVDLPDLEGFDSDDPEELIAAADELQDAEERLEEELAQIDDQISELERDRKLQTYAEDSRDSESIFDEESRPTKVVAKADQAGNTSSTTGGSAVEKQSGGAVLSNSDTNGGTTPTSAPNDDTADAAPPPENREESPAMGAAEPDSDGDGFAEAADPGVQPAPVPTPPDSVQPPPQDGGTTSDVRDEGADPVLVVREDSDVDTNAPSNGSVGAKRGDSKMKALKRKRSKVKRNIDRVSRQRKRLRSRADELSGGL